MVFIDGAYQEKSDYVLTNNSLELDTAPLNNEKIAVHTTTASVHDGTSAVNQQFTATAGQTAFTLSQDPSSENNTQVYINGVYQQKTDYTVVGTTLTFDTGLTVGDVVEVNMFTVATLGNTDTVTEGVGNLYHTTARARSAISVSGNALSYNSSTGVLTANFEEGPTFTSNVNITGDLDVGAADSNNAVMKLSANTGNWVFTNVQSNRNLEISDSDGTGTVFTIDTSGKVGIGTNTPRAKLSVNTPLTQSSADLRAIDIVVPGSWSHSGNAGYTSDITWTNSEAAGYVMGKFGLRYAGTSTGGNSEFVFKDMYHGGYGASADIMYLGSNGRVQIPGTMSVGGTSSAVGIGSTMADANIAELGPGYLNLARDDTADAKQISFSKNGVRVSDISTTDKGIKWEVLESSGNAAGYQFTNGVGVDLWTTMDNMGHKWQDNVYNASSFGSMSIGSDSSNTTHQWWNVYDTGSKYSVSSGYGMDEYVSNSNGDYVIRMGSNAGSAGASVALTQRYKFENAGALSIYGTGSGQSSNDGHLYIEKNNSNDWFVKLLSGSDDYGIFVRGNGSYALAVFNQPSNAYRARINYDGQLYLNGGSSAVYNINSDERLKEDITDCPSQWDLIKGLPLQRFHWKDRREGDKWSYGFIAQEVEKTNPEFVELVPQEKDSFENGEEDPKYKTVAEGQIHERALAALQEAMARIETLEAEVAALKG